ncbi:HD-GYP domain-containing protein [Oceanobacillus sp. Castelsardo]|uniref:HD-GYP domain-containing protein n=1 Tax=Oceanobacillus sp. Castelsardo TaxID=1851204 RepID=UPI0008383DFB|nr:HD-GYP domain-containing protein [Oceanobacillus sp. Castelsardo]
MQVKPSQLVPGCIVLKDVYGKTKTPIVPKNTVLTEKHIEILKGFLIESITVASDLNDGTTFNPLPVEKEVNEEKSYDKKTSSTEIPFSQHFLKVVSNYKQLYQEIQSGLHLDILRVRKLITPLLERIEEVDQFVHVLSKFGNRNEYLYIHSVAVSILASYLARKLNYEKTEWVQIGIAGLLSDSGMAKIDQNIVFRKGEIYKGEYENEITKHPTYSYRLVEPISTLKDEVKLAILQHHERLDGSGYPLGVKMEKIHKYAQIIAVCDVYHATISDRLSKEKKSLYQAVEELEKDRITKFNSKLVNRFAQLMINLKIGAKVKLSNQQVGEIVYMNPSYKTRPMVRMDQTNEIIALQNFPNLYIEEKL